ncbi:uncharacterized protein PRCAT00006249001 [Priceomyces carsonii]|uniref:uncharacterized protein n=1 Tax=Priceomyces carsonii TaxID=28549 RepID=UPI002EDB012F|nr:unnamed protein product [Priceomyces carsonii]
MEREFGRNTRTLLREKELNLLSSFIHKDHSLVPALIVHGYKSVGKTYVVKKFLETSQINHTLVNCDECVTKKLLLQRCLKKIRIDSGIDLTNYTQTYNHKGVDTNNIVLSCETFAGFSSALDQFFEETEYKEPHVLVLDRFDECMDQTNDLFAAFLRFHEISRIKNLSIVFIIGTREPKEIATNSVPHIFFRPYSQEEVTQILQAEKLGFFNVEKLDNSIEARNFWYKYAKLIVDLFFPYTGSHLTLLKDISLKLWERFIEPVVSGKYQLGDFVRLYRENSSLFTDENVLNNTSIKNFDTLQEEESTSTTSMSDIPIHSKFILIASYLASFNEPKNDLHHFSRLKTKKPKKRKVSSSPSKGKNSKIDIDNRLLSPNYFDLERLLAILSVIYRNESLSLNQIDKNVTLYDGFDEKGISNQEQEFAEFRLSKNIDINSQVATLVSLGLLSRTSASDILNAKVRWKCNLNWATVESIANDIKFPLLNYLLD